MQRLDTVVPIPPAMVPTRVGIQKRRMEIGRGSLHREPFLLYARILMLFRVLCRMIQKRDLGHPA